ncbi:MAG: DUF4058 family protein [Gemmataceae bacterium]|nr:DUF4058 family protein [Gemmataceae bacterium]
MPLLDHFHAPLHPRYPWESFHAVWAATLMEHLNRVLPPRYFATVQVHLGRRVEADVAEFDTGNPDEPPGNGPGAGVAVATWAPPKAALTVAAVFPDDIEVQVIDTRDGAVLVAVVELVSPGNKDRAAERRGFAAKCVAYLQRGIGVALADIVTSRLTNLHQEILELLGHSGPCGLPPETALYAASYRPARRQEENLIDVWPSALAVGSALPVLPLALRGAGCLPLDLETAYTEARQRSRL